MQKLKEKINMQNILCFFIVLCPILDMASFLFRNTFHTNISPSTFIRPVISIVVAIIIFIKGKEKRKTIFSRYDICHLWSASLSFISNSKNRDIV